MNLIIFILCSLGLTNIIAREFIFSPIRNFIDKHFHYSLLNKMVRCSTCLGFWIGIILSLLYPSLGVNWLLGGLISSIANQILEIKIYKL